MSGALLAVEMCKKCMALWREAPDCSNHTIVGTLLEVDLLKKRTLSRQQAHVEVKMLKHYMFGPLLHVQASFCAASARDSGPCQKWVKRGLCSAFKNDGRGRTFEEDLQRCISRDRLICLSICLSIYLSIYCNYRFIQLSIYMSICNFENEAILRDFLFFRTWKTKQVCETDWILKLTTSKTKQVCDTSFKNGNWVLSWQPRTNAFCDFPITSL